MADLSAYELARERQIAENQGKLRALGLDVAGPAAIQKRSALRKPPKPRHWKAGALRREDMPSVVPALRALSTPCTPGGSTTWKIVSTLLTCSKHSAAASVVHRAVKAPGAVPFVWLCCSRSSRSRRAP